MRALLSSTAAAVCALASCAQRAQPPSSTYASAPVESEPAAAGTIHDMHGMTADCPMDVIGAVVTSENIDGGIALVFTTHGGDVADLRGRVARIAESLDQGSAGTVPKVPGTVSPAPPRRPGPIPVPAQPAPAKTDPHHTVGDSLTGNIAVKAHVTDLPEGARLELRAESSADVEPLRLRARENALQMASGTCPSIDKAG